MNDQRPLAPDGYALVSQIGRGASSVVWEARRLATGRPVGLKLLEADVSDPDARRRFVRERDAMTALARHRNILTILDAGVQDGRPWLAMELCRRGSLARRIADGGPLDLAAALRVVVRLADALADSHDSGIVHCDIKPANVMVTDAGEPALGDFGIARVSVGRATTTTVGGFSLDHIAPELLDNGKRSPASDVYSLGTTTWELLVGHPPFRQSQDVSVGAVLTRILSQPLPESERIPPAVLELLRRMAAKAPHERPESMRQVGQEARALAAEFGVDPDGLPLPAAVAAEVVTTHVPLAVIDSEFAATATHHRLVAVPRPSPPAAAIRIGGRAVPAVAAALLLVVLIGGGMFVAYRFVGGWTTPQAAVAAPAAAPVVQPLAAAELVPTATPTTDTPLVALAAPAAPAPAVPGAGVVAPLPPAPIPTVPTVPTPSVAPSPSPSTAPASTAPASTVPTNPPLPPPDPDINGDGQVDCADLAILKASWGGSGPADLDRSGKVDVRDLSMLLSAWSGSGSSTACGTPSVIDTPPPVTTTPADTATVEPLADDNNP